MKFLQNLQHSTLDDQYELHPRDAQLLSKDKALVKLKAELSRTGKVNPGLSVAAKSYYNSSLHPGHYKAFVLRELK